jgi:8-oxo-dGTP pyrophosphatase MutT (NUDIX family)
VSRSSNALREVREEIGVRLLAYLGPAGATLHGYAEGDRYLIKRTTWLFLSTPEREFNPQREEAIDRVEWFGWSEAVERLGYPNLRRHLRRLGVEAAQEVLGS